MGLRLDLKRVDEMGRERNLLRQRAARQFGLPVVQVRFFEELSPAQVEEVSEQFGARLVGCEEYVYAVKRDGGLVHRRLRLSDSWHW